MTGLWLALSILASPIHGNVDAQINDLYERIDAAARDRDPELSRQAYAPDAVFLDEREATIQTGEVLHASMRESIEGLRRDGAAARISYRVVRRTVRENLAIDTGYYRVAVSPADRRAAPSIAYRKFLLAAEPRPDGRWQIIGDASLPSSQDAYDGAQPVSGLRFDR